MTSKKPEKMRQLLAYQTQIVWEARRCGGKGWLAYDSYFRQQAVGDDKADWSRLNQSLYAVTFIAQGERTKGRCCVLCLESDHAEEQCALYTPPPKQTYKKPAETGATPGRGGARAGGGCPASPGTRATAFSGLQVPPCVRTVLGRPPYLAVPVGEGRQRQQVSRRGGGPLRAVWPRSH